VEEKRRKEAHAHKGQLAVDLRGREEVQQRVGGVSVHLARSNERMVGSHVWKEDIAVYVDSLWSRVHHPFVFDTLAT
jgi:hypothetical protein